MPDNTATMNPEKILVKDYLKANQIIHLALMLGVVFFAIVAFFLVSQGFLMPEMQKLQGTFFVIVPLLALGSVAGSNTLFTIGLREAKTADNLLRKLTLYRSAHIVRLALIEAAAFLSVVVYLLTANVIFLGIAGIMVFVFVFCKPSRDKIISGLELTGMERRIMEDPEAVVG